MSVTIPLPVGAPGGSLAAAMDAECVRRWIEGHLLDEAELLVLSPNYVRYKGKHGSLVGWRVVTRTAAAEHQTYVTVRCVEPLRLRAEAERLSGRVGETQCGLRTWARVGDDGLLLAFPVDRVLRDLRSMVRASRVRRLIEEHAPQVIPEGFRMSKRRSHPVLVRYKPERRAVLRWELGLVGRCVAPGAVARRIRATAYRGCRKPGGGRNPRGGGRRAALSACCPCARPSGIGDRARRPGSRHSERG